MSKVQPLTNRRTEFDIEMNNKCEENFWQQIDPLNTGRVTCKELENKLLYSSLGDKLPDDGITELLAVADNNSDGYISKTEFSILMQNRNNKTGIGKIVRQACFLTIPRSGRTLKTRRYFEEFSCRPPPIFMIGISIAEVAIFIYETTKVDESLDHNSPVDFDSPLIYNPYKRCEAWRFLSNMLVHSGFLHLFYNILMQLALGIVLELVHKWWRVMLVYCTGVIGGSLAASITHPIPFLAGASGGVYAITFSYVGNLILNWSEMKFALIQAIVLLVLASADAGYAIFDTYYQENKSNTSHMAHIGGAITGILLGINILRNLEKKPWEKYCMWISLLILIGLFTAAILVHALAKDYFLPPAPECGGQ